MKTAKRFGRHQRRRQRSGYMYIVVLGLTTIVSIMAITTMMVARNEIRMGKGASDWQEARQLAMSAVEQAIATINSDPAWRTNYVNDGLNPGGGGISFSNGKMTWKLVDSDRDLNDGAHPVRIYGFGYVGDSVYVESVLVQPTGAALSCLQNSLQAGGDLTVDAGRITTNQTLGTNANASAVNSADVYGKVEAFGSISGATYNGIISTGIPRRQMPDAASVFDFYVSRGTPIAIWPLPWTGSLARLEKVVLSPTNNPFGDPNPDGVYVIDCDGWSIRIRNCRIVGTLVLLNPGEDSRIDMSVTMEPAIDYFPTLLVDGDFKFEFDQNELSEVFLLSPPPLNLNPIGTPFPYLNGTGTNEDNDVLDTYPSRIMGLVYVAKNLEVTAGAATVHGCVVTGEDCKVNAADLSLKYRKTWLNFPPPGFTVGDTMTISPGTWIHESSTPP